ncbi:hypothetical protein BpHYR1_046572, partial [Brachionus plicatilis]
FTQSNILKIYETDRTKQTKNLKIYVNLPQFQQIFNHDVFEFNAQIDYLTLSLFFNDKQQHLENNLFKAPQITLFAVEEKIVNRT